MKSALILFAFAAAKQTQHPKKLNLANLDASKRPVIGILTEPLRGDIISHDITEAAYIP